MNSEEKRQAAEALKNMIVHEKRSRWPMVIGVIVFLGVVGGAAYWFYLPPDQRPTDVVNRFKTGVSSFLNTPLGSSPATSPSSPSATPQKSETSSSKEDTGLLSN